MILTIFVQNIGSSECQVLDFLWSHFLTIMQNVNIATKGVCLQIDYKFSTSSLSDCPPV